MNSRINELKGELEDCKNSQGNIQNVLVSAQKFADQIVEEAKVKSAEIIASAQDSIKKITAQEKELTTAFDKKAGERKSALQSDIEKIITNAEKKQAAVQTATQECVERQQLLFDKMKIEVAAFKAKITAQYKEHLEFLASLPDTVPSDPTKTAKAVETSFEKLITVKEYAENPQDFEITVGEVETEAEALAEPVDETPAETVTGFVINSDNFDFDDDLSDNEEDI